MAAKFPLSRVRELHKHLTDILAQCDGTASASDNSDRGETWDPQRQGQDSARRNVDPTNTMLAAFPNLNRLNK
jgi:hypothetical protein